MTVGRKDSHDWDQSAFSEKTVFPVGLYWCTLAYLVFPCEKVYKHMNYNEFYFGILEKKQEK